MLWNTATPPHATVGILDMSWWRRRKKGKHVAVQGGVLSNPVIAEATEDLKRSVSRGAEVDTR